EDHGASSPGSWLVLACAGNWSTEEAGLGSAAVCASPLLLLLIPLPTPPAVVPPVPLEIPQPPAVPALPALVAPAAVPAPEAEPAPPPPPPPAPVPAPVLAQPNPDVKPTSNNTPMPPIKVLSVIGGLIAMALAGTGSGAVSFQSASAAQGRVDAARAAFFGPRA
ncbi:hypothetical protein ACWELQ_34335, partial [Nocardia sp. NPDC004722]